MHTEIIRCRATADGHFYVELLFLSCEYSESVEEQWLHGCTHWVFI